VAAPTKDRGEVGECVFLFKKASKYIIKAIPNCNCESHQTYLTRISHKGSANGGHPNTYSTTLSIM
jgi:hypothetical protein